jgi:hypothetical protein
MEVKGMSKRSGALVGWVFCAVMSAPTSVLGEGPSSLPTVDELLDAAGLDRYRDAIDDDEIVWLSAPGSEPDTNAVAGVMMARYPATVAEIVDALYNDPRISNSLADEIKDDSTESLMASFAQVQLAPSETKDIVALLDPSEGSGFNLSTEDIARLKALDKANRERKAPRNDADQASLSLRDLLSRRYLAYRDQGPEGIDDYQRTDSRTVSPGENLQTATGKYRLIAHYFPEFYAELEAWPVLGAEGGAYVHSLTWSREEQSGRPLFVLQHSMQDLHEHYALIVQRQYYISHTLDNLQVAMLMLPEGDRTVVFILTQTSTDKVAGMGRFVAAPIGRHMIKRNVQPIFTVLRDRFGS